MTGNGVPALEEDRIPFDDPGLERARRRLFARGSTFAPVAREEIAGLDPVVARVDELADWLEHANRFAEHGARVEPGALFEGPPGTGKTLLARYLASRTAARFVSVREFPFEGDELGPGDLRDLFAHARRAREESGRPVILFWDELDELCEPGPVRYPGGRPRVVAALLAELDGVRGKADGVLLVACSNRAEEIDPALLRPGRLGLRIEFRPPDAHGQRVLLGHEVDRYPAAEGIDLDALALLLGPGDTAAAIEETVADAWRTAVGEAIRTGAAPRLRAAHLERALARRLAGPLPSFLRLTDEERFRVAVHETGHALVALAVGVAVRLVSLCPGRGRLGQTLTEPLPAAPTLNDLLRELRVGLGGIAAEEVTGIGLGSGGAGDTLQASELALRCVELCAAGRRTGAFNPDATARRRSHRQPEISDQLLARADRDAAGLVARARRDAQRALRGHGREAILSLAHVLVEGETLTGPELAEQVERLGARRGRFQFARRSRRVTG